MKINKVAYQSLAPVPRAIAAYLAINRLDSAEAERLVSASPVRQGHGRAFFAVGQALDVYNRMAGEFAISLQSKLLECTNALAYCVGWLEAGVEPEDLSYLERYNMLGTLAAEVKDSKAQLEAVKQAAREWADRNKIPLEVFSEPMTILNLGEEAGSVTADEETLIAMRRLFDGVLLTW